jgi:microcompartment protein CcmK/EutM
MYLGRVIGRVWATVKNSSMEGQRLLLVQPLTPELKKTGKRLVCMDCTGAGAGELIYYCRGKEASFPFLPAEPCADSTVVGIVDSVHLRKAKKC